MSTYITTNTPSGKAVFSSTLSTEQPPLPMPMGSVTVLYSSATSPPSLASEDDIAAHGLARTTFFPPGHVCPPGGSAALQLTINPGGVGPMHRTMTLDVIVMVAGAVECVLDSGEVRTLRAGDVLVQRATIHQWRNVTPEGGEAKFVAFIQSLGVESLKVGEVVLGDEGLA